jgi:hypothetical protein
VPYIIASTFTLQEQNNNPTVNAEEYVFYLPYPSMKHKQTNKQKTNKTKQNKTNKQKDMVYYIIITQFTRSTDTPPH